MKPSYVYLAVNIAGALNYALAISILNNSELQISDITKSKNLNFKFSPVSQEISTHFFREPGIKYSLQKLYF